MSTLLQDIISFYKYGGKQLYYFNTFDGATDEVEEPAHPYIGRSINLLERSLDKLRINICYIRLVPLTECKCLE